MRRSAIWTLILGMTSAACSVKDSVEAAVEEVSEACDGLSLEEVRKADDLSDSCRAAIMNHLQGGSSNIYGRLLPLAKTVSTTGVRLYLAGISATGEGITKEDFATASLKVDDVAVPQTDMTVASLSDLAEPVALSIVNDYSGSMRDQDIKDAIAIEETLLACFTSGYEGQVILFSEAAAEKQAFTTDTAKLSAAIELDAAFPRTSTALYDGVGLAFEALAAREKPVKIALVATDGLENASTVHNSASLNPLRDDNLLFPIALGSLFADADELKDIAGERGIFVYANKIVDMAQFVTPMCNGLKNAVILDLPASYAGSTSFAIQVGEFNVSF